MDEKKTPQANLENKRSVWFFIGLMAVSGAILASLAWTDYDVIRKMNLSSMADDVEDEIIPVNIIQPPPPPPPPPAQTTIIEIVEDEEEIEEELVVEELELDEDTEIEIIEVEEEEEVEEVLDFFKVEKLPAYPGCEGLRGDELKSCTETGIIGFVQSNAKYSAIARDAGIQGKVYIYFEINKKGEIQNAEVRRGIHKSLDNEALKWVNKLPKMKPAEQRGKAVAIRYTIPVNFKIK